MNSNSSASRNRRKGPRRYLNLKIVVDGTDAFGERFSDHVATRIVTRDGGLFITSRRLRIGSTVRVSTPDAKFNAEAVIRNSRHDTQTSTYQCGFSFSEPVENWVLR